MNDFDQITYKGFTIDKFLHPQLYGKYEIHDKNGKFMGRTITIKEAKELINSRLWNQPTPN